jgi:hypothetical protein
MKVYLTRILIILTAVALIPLHCYLIYNFVVYFLFALLAVGAVFVIYRSCDVINRRLNHLQKDDPTRAENESTRDQSKRESPTSTITTFRVSRRRISNNSNNTVSPTASCSSASTDTITNLNRISPLKPVQESLLESIAQQHSSTEDQEPSSEAIDSQADQEVSQIFESSSHTNNNFTENDGNECRDTFVKRRSRPSLVRSDAISSDMFPLSEHPREDNYRFNRQSSVDHELLMDKNESSSQSPQHQLRHQQSLPERHHPHHMLLTGIQGTAAALTNNTTSGSSESGSILSEDDPIGPYLIYQQRQLQQQQISRHEAQNVYQYPSHQTPHFVPHPHHYYRRTTLGGIPRANTAPDCSRAGVSSSRLSSRRALSRQSDIPEEQYSSYSRSSLGRTSIPGIRGDVSAENQNEEESSPVGSVQTDINVRRKKSGIKVLQQLNPEQSDSFDRETNTSEGVQSDNISRSLSRQTTFSSTKEQDIQGLLRQPRPHSMIMQSPTFRTSCGYLELSHAYDAPSKKLQIEIREAGDLLFSGKDSVTSIYVKMTLTPIKKQKVKTKAKTISEERTVIFGDRFTFSRIHPEEVIGLSCRIRLYSSDKIHKQHVLFECLLSFARSRPLQTETKVRLNLEPRSYYSVRNSVPIFSYVVLHVCFTLFLYSSQAFW